ncbi:unnamed protein product [Soboliphyme baturini]|uniref:Down syndrome cell adhesion molecule-like protein Dscam2 n=1 Tax=Soboliphyme baturini TaxID=241478 RepID=A0A183IB35_9BILA|nr:unnamed protein product [Soboliphyme baturini]
MQVPQGLPLLASCDVGGIPRPHVLWRKATQSISSDFEVINLNRSLYLSQVSKHHEGLYVCEAENKCGKASKVVYVEVLQKPVFRDDVGKANLTVIRRNFVIFECFVEDGSNLSLHIQWMRHGHYIKANTSRFNILSRVMPKIRNFRASNLYNVPVGKQLTLLCVVQGTPKPKLAWFKGIEPLNRSDNHYVSRTGQELRFVAIRSTDAGHYICEASNSVGKDTLNLTVQIRAPIIESRKPRNLMKNCDIRLILSCSEPGRQPPTVHWLKNGFRLYVNDSEHILPDGRLQVNVRSRQHMRYTCFAESVGGVTAMDTFIVGVEVTRAAGVATAVVDVLDSNMLELAGEIIGSESLNMKWTFNGRQPELGKGRLRISSDGRKLLLKAVAKTAEGLYTCSGSTDGGKDEQIFHLRVKTHPRTTTTVRMASAGDSVRLECDLTNLTPIKVVALNTVGAGENHC